MGFLSSPDTDVEFVEPARSVEAGKAIAKIAKISPERIPLQEIAPFSELEQQAIDLAGEFLRDPSGEVTLDRAIEVAVQLAEQKINLDTPEIQGILQEVRKSGDLELNRISRQLQKSGTLSTTAGRDIIGRSITETERATAGALSPLFESFRARRLQATSLLPGLVAQRAGQTTGRIATGAAAGEAQRSLQQRIKDAVFARQSRMFEFETTGRANILSSLLVNPQAVVTGGGPSGLESITGAISGITSLINPASQIIGGISSLFKKPVVAGVPGAGGGLPGVGGARFPLTGVA